MDDASASLPIVAAAPVLGVEPGHVAEARRALLAQGRDVGEDAVTRLLWTARALPVALDVIADGRSGLSLADDHLGAGSVEISDDPPAAGTALVAVARLELDTVDALQDGTAAVVVQFLERRALLGTESDIVPARCTVRLPLSRPRAPADEPPPEDSVSVRRFTLGRPV